MHRTLYLLAVLHLGCSFNRSGLPASRPDATPDQPVDAGLVDGATERPMLGDLPQDLDLSVFDLDSAAPDQPLPSDGPMLDVPVSPDLPPTPDLPVPDLPVPDLPVPDLPSPDQPTPDLPPLDVGLGDAMNDAAIALCQAKFGGAPDYVLCWVTPSGCAFNATTNGDCNSMCQSLGSTCLAAWDNPNDPGKECDILGPDSCSKSRGTNICMCAK